MISKITADLSKHPIEEIKNEAIRMIRNNGWYANSTTDYLGTSTEINLKGTPGKDFAVSESGLYEFK